MEAGLRLSYSLGVPWTRAHCESCECECEKVDMSHARCLVHGITPELSNSDAYSSLGRRLQRWSAPGEVRPEAGSHNAVEPGTSKREQQWTRSKESHGSNFI